MNFFNKKYIIIQLLLWGVCINWVFNPSTLLAQKTADSAIPSKIQKFVTYESTANWLNFKDTSNITGTTFFSKYKADMDLSINDEMRLVKTEKDITNFEHFRYQQYYKGLKVEGAEFIIHDYEGKSKSANGKLARNLNLLTTPSISPENALEIALANINANVYMWESKQEELELQEVKEDPSATYYPQPELMLTTISSNDLKDSTAYHLVYKIDIYTLIPSGGKAVYINAENGEILQSVPLVLECDIAHGNTTWHGRRSFRTDQHGSQYVLEDDCDNTKYHTRYYNKEDNKDKREYIDLNNDWNSANDLAGVTTHWSLRKAHRYFYYVHDRNGWNNIGGNINAFNNATFYYDADTTDDDDREDDPYFTNASWNSLNHQMRFGAGNTDAADDDYNTLDIVGHEFAHGVIFSSALLRYKGESGALNESFADIFGTMIERYVEGDAFDWEIGEDKGRASRDLSNPKRGGDPDTYEGNLWVDPESDDDDGGVHTNSGVQNYWFYLLCEGGSGINDNGDAYEVNGIGISKSRRIAYLTLTQYLTSRSNYHDARKASLQAAIQLYGSCSEEVIEVGKAWYAVGVGREHSFYDREVCGSIMPIGVQSYRGINSLTAGESCNTTILPNQLGPSLVIFKAANEIILKPGFTANSGANLIAFLDPCAYTAYPSNRLGREVLDTEEAVPLDTQFQGVDENIGNSMTVYPNPFSQATTIKYTLLNSGNVNIYIRNALGQTISTLASNVQKMAGTHSVQFEGGHLPSGMYFCVLETREERCIKKIIVTR